MRTEFKPNLRRYQSTLHAHMLQPRAVVPFPLWLGQHFPQGWNLPSIFSSDALLWKFYSRLLSKPSNSSFYPWGYQIGPFSQALRSWEGNLRLICHCNSKTQKLAFGDICLLSTGIHCTSAFKVTKGKTQDLQGHTLFIPSLPKTTSEWVSLLKPRLRKCVHLAFRFPYNFPIPQAKEYPCVFNNSGYIPQRIRI